MNYSCKKHLFQLFKERAASIYNFSSRDKKIQNYSKSKREENQEQNGNESCIKVDHKVVYTTLHDTV